VIWRSLTPPKGIQEGTQVSVKAETLRARTQAISRSLRHQWRAVILPALLLWILAAIVSTAFLHTFDLSEYARYAHAALRAPLLHRLPLEYPAPALAIFLLPLLLPLPYTWAFAVFAGIALILLVASYEGSGVPGMDADAARRLIVYLAVGAVMVLTGRYDIFAVLPAFLAVRAAGQDRWSAAWTWSCIGFVLKLYPAILWPALLIAEWRRSGRLPVRRLLWMVSAAFVLAGLPALLNRTASLNALRFYIRRPTEIGSLSAGLSLLLDGHGTRWINTFHSVNVVNSVVGPISLVLEILAVVGCLWAWRAQIQGRLPFEAACLATLTVVLLGSKVLSVQYLMWLMPLWALFRMRAMWFIAALINVVTFPYSLSALTIGYVPGRTFVILLTVAYLVRNLLLLVGTAMWVRSVLVEHPPSGADSGSARWSVLRPTGSGGRGPRATARTTSYGP
jgi:hypothetical protein